MKNGLPGFYRVSRHRGAAVRFLELLIDTTSRWWLRAWKSFFLLWSAVLRFPFFFYFLFFSFLAWNDGLYGRRRVNRVDEGRSVNVGGLAALFFSFSPCSFLFCFFTESVVVVAAAAMGRRRRERPIWNHLRRKTTEHSRRRYKNKS